jgi:hypothetical protein
MTPTPSKPSARAFARLATMLCALVALAACAANERIPTRPPGGDGGGPGVDGGGGGADAATDFGRPFVPDLGPPPVCEVAVATAEPLPSTLAFLLDTSGSMNCNRAAASCLTGDPTPAPDDSRWDVMRRELDAALAGLPDATRAGVLNYPKTFGCIRTSDAPLVPVDVLSTNRARITAATGGLTPMGITPTRDGVQAALAVLRAQPATEPRYLVLATDGAATVCLGCDAACSFEALDRDNDALVEDVRAAAAEGIGTFVVGVPGSQSYRGVLSRLARAGGTAPAGCSDAGPVYCHADLTDAATDFAAGLRAALAAIGGAIERCDYTIPPNPDGTFDPASVNVVLYDASGAETGRLARDPARANGWDYSDDGTQIVLHGAACDDARATDGRVEVQFGCPTIFL